MTKEEIRLKAVDNAKKYEVWPPAADYQDGLIKGFEDGAEWMLDDPTGGALLYTVEKTAERTKREMIKKAVEWLDKNVDSYCFNTGNRYRYIPKVGRKMLEDFKKAMQDESRRLD